MSKNLKELLDDWSCPKCNNNNSVITYTCGKCLYKTGWFSVGEAVPSGRIDIFRFQIDGYRNANMNFPNIHKSINDKQNIISENRMSHNMYNMDRSKDVLHTEEQNKYYKMYSEISTKQSLEYFSDYKDKNYLKKNEIKERIILCTQKLREFTDSISKLTKHIINNEYSYIRKIIIRITEKIVIFGDYHGSYHTFFRNMLRLHLAGVINLNNYTVNDNYRLVFLGDIVDRGKLDVEILDLLFRFIINDNIHNPRLIINRGNHEEILTNMRYGFKDEIITKFEEEEIFNNINNIFNLLPSAIILHNVDNNENYWLCHGCVPLFGKDNKIFDHIKTFVGNPHDTVIIIGDNIATQIRWNDKGSSKNDHRSNRDKLLGTIFTIGTDTIKKYLEIFNFIIRGHQDNIAHASLLASINENFIIGSKTTYDNKNMFSINPSRNEQDTAKIVSGPIESINTYNPLWPQDQDIYKVLTISTNNDIDRNLDSDSFIILHFNKEKTNILDNINILTNQIEIQPWLDSITHDSERLEERVDMSPPVIDLRTIINDAKIKYNKYGNSETTYYKKYLKYKEKYLELKKN